MSFWLRVSFLLTVFASAGAVASGADKLDNLRQQIITLQQEQEKTAAARGEASDELRDSERAISDSNRRLFDLTRQRTALTRKLDALHHQRDQLQRRQQDQQVILARLLYQHYLDDADHGYLKLWLSHDDPNQLARNLYYFEHLARDRTAVLSDLRHGLKELASVADQVSKQKHELESLHADMQQQHRTLEKHRFSRQHVLNKIAVQLKQQRNEIAQLQYNERYLSRLVGKIQKTTSDIPPPALRFTSLKGNLKLPVGTRIYNHFGGKRPDSNLPWTGWFLRSSANQPVRNIAPGLVVYADWLRGFGNLIIIDHGQGYMSLYGNNEALYKQVGEAVQAGETIASVGNSGGNPEYGLYFELRFEGKPLDPASWVRH